MAAYCGSCLKRCLRECTHFGYALLDSAVGYARGWRPESVVERAIWIFIAAALAITTAALAFRRGRRFYRTRSWRLLLMAAVTVAALGAAEVAVALVLRPVRTYGEFHLKPPGSHFVSRPDPARIPGVTGDSHYRTNDLGIRGPACPPRDEAYRILCVGGSTTICTYLDDEETWPHLLMERLDRGAGMKPVWVGNAGKNGYSSPHHLVFLETTDLLTEMDCVVLLVGINDFAQFLYGKKVRLRVRHPPLWRRSGLGEVLVRTVDRLFTPALEVEDEAGAVYELRREVRRRARKLQELPDLEAGLGVYEGRIRRMIEAVRRKGARPVFLSQPVLWRRGLSPEAESLLWFGLLTTKDFLSTAALRAGMDLYNARLRKVCADTVVEFVDLSAMHGREAYFYDDCHLTEAGAREFARLVAGHFKKERSAASWNPGGN